MNINVIAICCVRDINEKMILRTTIVKYVLLFSQNIAYFYFSSKTYDMVYFKCNLVITLIERLTMFLIT